MSCPRRLVAALLPLLVLAGLLAGCGEGGASTAAAAGSSAAESAAEPTSESESESESASDAEDADAEGRGQAGTPATVDCPAQATAVELPADFAAPLPEGTVVVDVEERSGGRTVVTGVVPAAEPDVLTELQSAYPAAGLTLTEGETEARDAESNFTGPGLTGRWGIRELTECGSAATRIDVVVRAG